MEEPTKDNDAERNECLERFLQVVDKSQPGMKREAVPLVFDENGKPVWGIITWRKP